MVDYQYYAPDKKQYLRNEYNNIKLTNNIYYLKKIHDCINEKVDLNSVKHILNNSINKKKDYNAMYQIASNEGIDLTNITPPNDIE